MKNSSDTIWNRNSDLPILAQHLNQCAAAVLTMVQVELNNMYINIGANSGSEKL